MEEELKHRHVTLVPKGQSYTSIMLNGMGNGAMLAAIPAFVGTRGLAFLTKKPIDEKGIITAVITSLGAIVGAIHGKGEANISLKYRAEVADKVNQMQATIDNDQNKIAELYAAVQAKEATGKNR